MKRKCIVLVGALIGIFLFSISWASDSSRTLDLSPTAKHPGANGTAFIGDNHISVQARGLKHESVYTVWFVNMKPNKKETGAGSAPFMFKTDKWGNGNYSAPLDELPFGKWSMLMVVLHPNGDPMDMKGMVGALKVSL